MFRNSFGPPCKMPCQRQSQPREVSEHFEFSISVRLSVKSHGNQPRLTSRPCSPAGMYNCGTCRCEPGYLGARCECQEGDPSSLHLSSCREAEGKQVCSGRGECSCNQCVCYESEFGKIYGSFCECDDFSCPRHKGVLCSGETSALLSRVFCSSAAQTAVLRTETQICTNWCINIFTSLTLSTGAPQGCVLSPMLFSLYTVDCTRVYSTNTTVKLADDATVIDPISNNELYTEMRHTSWRPGQVGVFASGGGVLVPE